MGGHGSVAGTEARGAAAGACVLGGKTLTCTGSIWAGAPHFGVLSTGGLH